MKITRPLLVFVMLAIAAIAVFGNRIALATGKTPPKPTQDQEQAQEQQQGQAQQQRQAVHNEVNQQAAGGQAVNEGVDVANNTSTSSDYDFFAFSTSFPNATGCMGGAQAGGGGNGGAGFLGLHFINTSCWMNQLAEAEKSLDMRARLKCGDRKFRNAVAYDVKRKDRRQRCIDYSVSEWQKEIQVERRTLEQISKLQADKQRLDEQKRACLEDRQIMKNERDYCYQKLDDSTK